MNFLALAPDYIYVNVGNGNSQVYSCCLYDITESNIHQIYIKSNTRNQMYMGPNKYVYVYKF